MDLGATTFGAATDVFVNADGDVELGTSAKMLSIVPMLAGGGMYETGAGRWPSRLKPLN